LWVSVVFDFNHWGYSRDKHFNVICSCSHFRLLEDGTAWRKFDDEGEDERGKKKAKDSA